MTRLSTAGRALEIYDKRGTIRRNVLVTHVRRFYLDVPVRSHCRVGSCFSVRHIGDDRTRAVRDNGESQQGLSSLRVETKGAVSRTDDGNGDFTILMRKMFAATSSYFQCVT
jgi:hypothetical protein